MGPTYIGKRFGHWNFNMKFDIKLHIKAKLGRIAHTSFKKHLKVRFAHQMRVFKLPYKTHSIYFSLIFFLVVYCTYVLPFQGHTFWELSDLYVTFTERKGESSIERKLNQTKSVFRFVYSIFYISWGEKHLIFVS